MADVIAQYREPLVGRDGLAYRAQAVGAPSAAGLWEGWLEFIPVVKGAAVRSARETTQPNRQDTEYWATGLTPVYLEGALARALAPVAARAARTPRAIFNAPARSAAQSIGIDAPVGRALLDPFSVFEKGEALLRRELQALEPWHLVNIVTAYQLSCESMARLNRMRATALVETIVAAVRAR